MKNNYQNTLIVSKNTVANNKLILISYINKLLKIKEMFKNDNNIVIELIRKLNFLFLNKTSKWYKKKELLIFLEEFLINLDGEERKYLANFRISLNEGLVVEKNLVSCNKVLKCFKEDVNLMYLINLNALRYLRKKRNIFKFWYEKFKKKKGINRKFSKFLIEFVGLKNYIKIKQRLNSFFFKQKTQYKKKFRATGKIFRLNKKFFSNKRFVNIRSLKIFLWKNKKRQKIFIRKQKLIINKKLNHKRKLKRKLVSTFKYKYKKYLKNFRFLSRIKQIRKYVFLKMRLIVFSSFLELSNKLSKELFCLNRIEVNSVGSQFYIQNVIYSLSDFYQNIKDKLPFLLLYKKWYCRKLLTGLEKNLFLLKRNLKKSALFDFYYEFIKRFRDFLYFSQKNNGLVLKNKQFFLGVKYIKPKINKLLLKVWKRKNRYFLFKNRINRLKKKKFFKRYSYVYKISSLSKAKSGYNLANFFFRNVSKIANVYLDKKKVGSKYKNKYFSDSLLFKNKQRFTLFNKIIGGCFSKYSKTYPERSLNLKKFEKFLNFLYFVKFLKFDLINEFYKYRKKFKFDQKYNQLKNIESRYREHKKFIFRVNKKNKNLVKLRWFRSFSKFTKYRKLLLYRKYFSFVQFMLYNKVISYTKYRIFSKIKGLEYINLKKFNMFLNVIRSQKFLTLLKLLNCVFLKKKMKNEKTSLLYKLNRTRNWYKFVRFFKFYFKYVGLFKKFNFWKKKKYLNDKKTKTKIISLRHNKIIMLKNVKKSKVFNSSIFFDIRRLNILYKCYFYGELLTKKFKDKSLVIRNLVFVLKSLGFWKMYQLYTHKFQGFFIKKFLKWNNACGNNILYNKRGCELEEYSLKNKIIFKTILNRFFCKSSFDLFKVILLKVKLNNESLVWRSFFFEKVNCTYRIRMKKKRKILSKFFINVYTINKKLKNDIKCVLNSNKLALLSYLSNTYILKNLYLNLRNRIFNNWKNLIGNNKRFVFKKKKINRAFVSNKRVYWHTKFSSDVRKLTVNLRQLSPKSLDKNFIIRKRLYRKYYRRKFYKHLIRYSYNYLNVMKNFKIGGSKKLFKFFKGFFSYKKKRYRKNWNRFKWEYMRKQAWSKAKRKYKIRIRRYKIFKRNLVTKSGKVLKTKIGIGRIILRRVRRNFFFTFTDAIGNVIYTANGGLFRIKKRKERFKWEVLRKYLKKFRKLSLIFNTRRIIYYKRVRNVFMHKKLLKYFKIGDFELFYIFPEYIRAHNGCRRKKKRRL